MAFNPLNNNSEDTSFEQGSPISQTAKNVAKAVSAQAQAQSKAATQAIVDQLYGATTPTEQPSDDSNPQQATAPHHPPGTQQSANGDTSKSPEDQAKMEKIRHELFGSYASKFKSASNTPPGMVSNDIEQEMEKARKEREQKEEQRRQEEEQEAQRKKEEEESKKQDLAMPAGKKTGVMMGRKQQQPIELERAKTRTEINRGTTG